jgi:hypothetical protein
MGKDFTVTITNEERAAEWEETLGTRTVHVKSPLPSMATLPGYPAAMIYELDLEMITPEQRERLVAHLAQKFGIPADEVAAQLDQHGVPILADDCTVMVRHPQRWF